ASDTGYQRLWERAAAPVLRAAAAEGRLFEMLTKDCPDAELTLADEHPYAAMLPLRISSPRTSAVGAACRAGSAVGTAAHSRQVRHRSEQRLARIGPHQRCHVR